MKHEWKQEPKEISYEILQYLMDNPEAQGTLEGIVEWWLLEQDIKRNTVLIRNVLAELIKKGLLIVTLGKDMQEHYSINPDKFDEISELVKAGRSRM